MKILLSVFFASLVSGSVIASEVKNETDVLFDTYAEVTNSIRSSGWKYLGCASSKSTCTDKAEAQGYSESKLVYSSCTPRNSNFSCFAK